jgi:hypothetical protein
MDEEGIVLVNRFEGSFNRKHVKFRVSEFLFRSRTLFIFFLWVITTTSISDSFPALPLTREFYP